MQGGACGTENCDGRGLMYSAWPIRVGWVAGSGWMPIWLTNADQLRSAHAEPGSQSNQPQSARVSCGSSVKSVFWIWSLRPGCSKVSWDLWNGTIVASLISHSKMVRQRRRATAYFFNIMLSHMDHLVTRPSEILTITISYGGLINSPIWHRTVAITYIGLNISSVWLSNYYHLIKMTY